MMHNASMSDSLGTRNPMSERRRVTIGRQFSQDLLFTILLIAPLMYLSGCGSGQNDVGQANGNSVPVSLSISMPQESAAASTNGSRFWATLQSWLPTPTNAWAVTYSNLTALKVVVTGPGLPSPITTNFIIPPESLPPQSGDAFPIILDVPVGLDRVFTVSGLNLLSGELILQGESDPITLPPGQPATVPITLAVVGQPTISDPASLPIGVVGTPYSASLTAAGGTPPYTWSVTPPLPARLTFTPGGSTATISGTPQAGTIGTTNHTFSVTDSTSPTPRTGTRSYSVTIAPPGLAIATSSLPNGTVTQRYSATIAASGGTPPYTWSVVGGLTPAPGLSLSPSGPTAGQISGTPSTNDGTPYTRIYQVQDSAIPPRTSTKSLSIAVILPSAPNITTRTLPNGAFRQSYNQTLQVSGGTPPFVWRFTGALPTGLSLNPQTGTITGTAGATGTFNFTANVTDATGQTDPAPPALSITITTPPPPTITTPSPLPTGTVNQPYPATRLTATGGAPPLTWDPVVNPPLPNGLMFDPNTATISGIPLNASSPTTHTFTVRDSTAPSNQTGTKGLLLTINRPLTTDTVTGTVTHALNGSPIASASVRVVNTSLQTSTDANGRFTLNDVPQGSRTIEAIAIGFVTNSVPVNIVGGQTQAVSISLSPIVSFPDQIRIILNWGAVPLDLDSHLCVPSTPPFEIYYDNKGRLDASPFALLDIDDTTGFGPETVTISAPSPSPPPRFAGTYRYFVRNFSRTPPLTTSDAFVQVLNSNTEIARFTVPTTGTGLDWEVFTLDGVTGTITPVEGTNGRITTATCEPVLF